jgi:hypothetical protein
MAVGGIDADGGAVPVVAVRLPVGAEDVAVVKMRAAVVVGADGVMVDVVAADIESEAAR